VPNQIWVVGIINRSTKQIQIGVVQNHGAQDLPTFIAKWTNPGSTIMSDEWKGYTFINSPIIPYTHQTVCHKTDFVNAQDPNVHMQTIERSWVEVKALKIIKKGIQHCDIQEHLDEVIFRKECKIAGHDSFDQLMKICYGTSQINTPITPVCDRCSRFLRSISALFEMRGHTF
jgi:hypothetical protein